MITTNSNERRRRRPLVMERLENRFAFAAGEVDLTFANQGVLEVDEWLHAPNDYFGYADIRSHEDGNIDLIVLKEPADQLEWVRFKRDGTRDLSFDTSTSDDSIEPGPSQLDTIILRQYYGLIRDLRSKEDLAATSPTESRKRFFYPDVTNDGYVAPDDVRMVIDEIGASSAVAAANAEGETLDLVVGANDEPHSRRRLEFLQHWVVALDE